METTTQTTQQSTDIVVLASATDIVRAFGNAALFASTDKVRPAINSVKLELVAGSSEAKVVATDSYQLAWDTFQLTCEALETVDVILPRDFVLAVVKLLKANKGQASISIEADSAIGRKVTVETFGSSVAETAYPGEFPNYRQLITDATDFAGPVGLNPTYLARYAKVVVADVRPRDIQPPLVVHHLDPMKPARFTIGETFGSILMPVRLAK